MTPAAYAKQEIKAGRMVVISIVPGQFGTYWLEDKDYKTLDKACFQNRESAEKARSKAIEKALKYI